MFSSGLSLEWGLVSAHTSFLTFYALGALTFIEVETRNFLNVGYFTAALRGLAEPPEKPDDTEANLTLWLPLERRMVALVLGGSGFNPSPSCPKLDCVSAHLENSGFF